MKDHELRELINDVTAVAQIYAHTQQLREQIAHLIAPVFKKLKEDQRRLKIPAGMTDELIGAAEKYSNQYNNDDRQDVFTDVLNAFYHGAEFSATFREKEVENLNRQLDFEAKQRTELRKELAAAQAAANNSSVENIVLKKRLFQAEGRNGPDFTDGHDCEGFAGGCERMGCPGGSECTELPANKK
jgi:hypothetical protein